jgi:anti-sigma B factor antagonist
MVAHVGIEPVVELGLNTENTFTTITVRCTGRITSSTTRLLNETVRPLFANSKKVILDLTGVTYMDSSGLGTVVGLYLSATRAGSKLQLVNLHEPLKELLRITKLGAFLDAEDDVAIL